MKGSIVFDIGKDDPQHLQSVAEALGAKPKVHLMPGPVDLTAVRKVCACIQAGNKIGAIKEARNAWGLSLKDAKDLVEGVGS